jgi:hypothetical protein
MPFPFFDANTPGPYKIAVGMGLLASIILLTRNKQLLTRFLDNFLAPHMGDFAKRITQNQKPYLFELDSSSESVFNQNCYHYLVEIKENMPDYIQCYLPQTLLAAIFSHCNRDDYHPHIAYGNLYRSFFEALENDIITIYDEHKDADKDTLYPFIDKLFANNNHSLERTFNKIKDAINQLDDIKTLRKNLSLRVVSDDLNDHNHIKPSDMSTWQSRGISVTESDNKMQYITNIPSIRHYQHTHPFAEYRFGTQGQRDNNTARINPFFDVWCASKAPVDSKRISHIYFNNLGRDRNSFEGRREKAYTECLHELEKKYPYIAVITLPADKGLFDQSLLSSHKEFDTTKTLALFSQIAMQEKQDEEQTTDFYISQNVRARLFDSSDTEREVIQQLLQKSLTALNLSEKDTLTAQEKQALYLHFIKFELTDYILAVLQPDSINFACKDAIDRAGVSSGYYNLLKSIEMGQPMSRDEFEMGLHAAPALVKGRAMNKKFSVLHSALTYYAKANTPLLERVCPWVLSWCEHYKSPPFITPTDNERPYQNVSP